MPHGFFQKSKELKVNVDVLRNCEPVQIKNYMYHCTKKQKALVEREILSLRYIKDKKNELPAKTSASCKEPQTNSFWAERPGTNGKEIIRISQNSHTCQRFMVNNDGNRRQEREDPDRLEIVIYRQDHEDSDSEKHKFHELIIVHPKGKVRQTGLQ